MRNLGAPLSLPRAAAYGGLRSPARDRRPQVVSKATPHLPRTPPPRTLHCLRLRSPERTRWGLRVNQQHAACSPPTDSAMRCQQANDGTLETTHPPLSTADEGSLRPPGRSPAAERLCSVALSALLGVALTVTAPSEALAKGGGHGGGGGGGHGSPRTRLYPRYYHSGGDQSSYVLTEGESNHPELYDNENLARDGGGYYCPPSLPKPGDQVRVEGLAGSKATVVEVNRDKICELKVDFPDGTAGFLFAGAEPESPLRPWIFVASFGLVALGLSKDEEMKTWEDKERKNFEKQDLLAACVADYIASGLPLEPPTSGVYSGSTAESDGMAQDVSVTLDFKEDGRIVGMGSDGADGDYHVKGTWAPLAEEGLPWGFAWCEDYSSSSLRVLVQGKLKRDGETQVVKFVSNREVTGSFTMKLKETVDLDIPAEG